MLQNFNIKNANANLKSKGSYDIIQKVSTLPVNKDNNTAAVFLISIEHLLKKLQSYVTNWLELTCNPSDNVSRRFHVLSKFFSPQLKQSVIISNKHGIY